MNIYERRRKALQNLLDYWEQSIGMMKAVDYTATDPLFVAAVQWRHHITKAMGWNEARYSQWRANQKRGNAPPWE